MYARREDEAAKLVGLMLRPLNLIPSYSKKETKFVITVYNTQTQLNVVFSLYTSHIVNQTDTVHISYPKTVAVACNVQRPFYY